MGGLHLSRGAPIHAEDGAFGELSDVVVDPFTHVVTHIVADPGGDHQQTRLIPIWLVTQPEGDRRTLMVSLPSKYIQQLQRALQSDYVRIAADHAVGTTVDRFRSLLTLPLYRDPSITNAEPDAELLPRGDCEIRRSSWVVGRRDRVLGTVEGLLLRGDGVHSVVVRSGLVRFRQNVAVPIGAVRRADSHLIVLSIDSDEFRRLPTTGVIPLGGRYLRPREIWQEVLGRPNNKLWDDLEIQDAGSPEPLRRDENESNR